MSPLVNSETNVHACRGANVGTLFMFERNAASSALQAWRADCRVCTVEEPPPPRSPVARSLLCSLFLSVPSRVFSSAPASPREPLPLESGLRLGGRRTSSFCPWVALVARRKNSVSLC
ncbi:hypothetical protein TGRUB_310110 [Toxoplasma gondii RUB]|uniref:Uncharacterized protein n=1 Tax=Toxoplasma gondii RUB TaxID=935652 RepID=A0A086MA42_TOXGO|nr:hypothetical protein TGRUB_310110 [Toxoplasma gondii RUB]